MDRLWSGPSLYEKGVYKRFLAQKVLKLHKRDAQDIPVLTVFTDKRNTII